MTISADCWVIVHKASGAISAYPDGRIRAYTLKQEALIGLERMMLRHEHRVRKARITPPKPKRRGGK